MGSGFNEEENTMSLLNNKIAVVTGGSSGIGLATAKRFVEEGAYVFIVGRRQAELDKAVAAIGKDVSAVEADISKLEDLDRLYETVAKKGKIDVIFAGAAFVEKMMTAEATPEHFDKIFDTNARGTYFTVQKALPYLNDGASIILVAAAGKNKGMPGRSAYSATKAAIRSLCSDVDQRTEGSKDQDQRAQPWRRRHAHVRRSVPVRRGRGRSQEANHCDDASGTPGDGLRRSLPRLYSSPRT